MLLHEAIIHVLQQNGRPMSTREIADEINKQCLYSRQDNTPVPASQISARVNRKTYARLFTKTNGLIGLSELNI